MASSMVPRLPLWGNDRSFPHLDNTVTGGETYRHGRVDDLDVGPLEAVTVNVVGDLAKQNTLGLENSVGLSDKGRVEMREVVP